LSFAPQPGRARPATARARPHPDLCPHPYSLSFHFSSSLSSPKLLSTPDHTNHRQPLQWLPTPTAAVVADAHRRSGRLRRRLAASEVASLASSMPRCCLRSSGGIWKSYAARRAAALLDARRSRVELCWCSMKPCCGAARVQSPALLDGTAPCCTQTKPHAATRRQSPGAGRCLSPALLLKDAAPCCSMEWRRRLSPAPKGRPWSFLGPDCFFFFFLGPDCFLFPVKALDCFFLFSLRTSV
jgi:hypothetical protein